MASFEPSEDRGGFGTVEVMAHYGSCAIGCDFGTSAPRDACGLFLMYDEIVYLLASTADKRATNEIDGITGVKVFHRDARDFATTTVTTGPVRENHVPPDWTILVHYLTVQLRPDGCFVSYLIEFADDEAALYSQ
jgi:hypothetical protein